MTASSPAEAGRASGSTPASRPATRSSTHYDAMLAKVIAWAPTREQAIRMLVAARWPSARIHGLITNRDLLVEILPTRVPGRRDHDRLPRVASDRR